MLKQINNIFILLGALLYLSSCQTIGHNTDSPLDHKVGMGEAPLVLQHLLHGSVPQYENSPEYEQYERSPHYMNMVLKKDEYCFARGHGVNHNNLTPHERFVKNTKAFLVPFAEKVGSQEISQKEYLDKDKTVQRWVYGDAGFVVINFGTEPYRYAQTLLPPMGFIAAGPDFLAQHYYRQAGINHSTLIVKHDGKTYYGFK